MEVIDDGRQATEARLSLQPAEGVPERPSCQDIVSAGEDTDVRRRWAEWRLQRAKIVFFFSLVYIPAAAVASSAAASIGQVGLAIGLSLSAVPFVRLLTGAEPPLALLLKVATKIWALSQKAGPPW